MPRFIFLTENVNILIHSVVYLSLVYYPYQNRTRFSKKTTVILCVVYLVVDAVIILAVGDWNAVQKGHPQVALILFLLCIHLNLSISYYQSCGDHVSASLFSTYHPKFPKIQKLCMTVSYCVVLNLIWSMNKETLTEQKAQALEDQIEAQKHQWTGWKKVWDEQRRERHDYRYHLCLIQEQLNHGKYEQITNYITEYLQVQASQRAARREKAYIKIDVRMLGTQYIIKVENYYEQTHNKKTQWGIGLASVQAIASQYGARINIYDQEARFDVNLIFDQA
ncbi:MAG: GHKL domain-containing protein [Hespellia sp.]|nr:GHKL domain-containing protein [Hespellia sp.]